MLMERRVRHQEHRDRKRVLEVFQSNNAWVQAQVEEMLAEDIEPKFFTRGLDATLRMFGAPPGDVSSMLRWFRYNCGSIQYTKHLRCQYEFVETYLLYLGQAEIFQKRFLHVPQPWLFSVSNSTPALNTPPSFTREARLSNTNQCHVDAPILNAESHDLLWHILDDTNYQNSPTFDSAYGFCPLTPTYEKPRSASKAFRRALQFLWLTLSRRGCMNLLGCASRASVLEATGYPNLARDNCAFKNEDKLMAISLEPLVYSGILT